MMRRNSAYAFINASEPTVLRDIAAAIGKRVGASALDIQGILGSPLVMHGFNIYRRMGDLELYCSTIGDELKEEDPWRAATVVGSLLVGYFSAAKSMLDAAALALNQSHQLGLALKNQDFGKGALLAALRASSSTSAARYDPLRPFFQEVIQWRDSAVHRTTPLVMVHTKPGFEWLGPPAKGSLGSDGGNARYRPRSGGTSSPVSSLDRAT
jgi:hypothetical protein